MSIGQGLSGPDDGGQVAFHDLFVQIGLVEIVGSRDVHVVETGDIPVAPEVLQELDLPEGTFGENLLAEDIGHLLDGNAVSGRVVGGRAAIQNGPSASVRNDMLSMLAAPGSDCVLPNDPVCTLSKLLGDRVPVVDDEVLIEDFEILAAL